MDPGARDAIRNQLLEYLIDGPDRETKIVVLNVLLRDYLSPKDSHNTYFGRFGDTIENYIRALRASRFGTRFLDMLYETFQLVGYVGAIALLHHLLGRWFGPDPKVLVVS